jgi:Iron-containing redox enzyme
MHRSAYQLKEADPHTWAIPRLYGAPKAAMIEIQADEYGSGNPRRAHSELFARAMEAVGLDSTYGAYLDLLPATTLATVNLMSSFGLNRGRRGMLVGHLAMFEISSPIPNSRYAKALRRLGFDGEALEFFDEHVEADSVHENIAAYDLAQGLAVQQPELAADIVWGAEALLELERRFSTALLEAWAADGSALRQTQDLVSL